VEKIRSSCRME